MTDLGTGHGLVLEKTRRETVWRVLILTISAAVVIFSAYCLSHGITIIFMHLYYFPIVLLAYRYRLKGFILAVILSLIYLGLVLFYASGQSEIITGALCRFMVFVGVAAVIAYLSEQLVSAQMMQNEVSEIIRDLQQFQQSVIENANVWITVLAPDGKILVWNDAAERVSGYKHGEVLGNSTIWRRLYPEKEYRRRVTGEIQRIIGRDNFLEDFETEIRCGDGTAKVIVWNTRGLKGADGAIQSYIAIGRDITKQKRAEETFRESEEKYRTLFENMLEGFAYCRMLYDENKLPSDFIYLHVNRAFDRIIGIETVTGIRATELFPGIKEAFPKLFEIYGRVASTRKPESFDIDFTPIGKWLHISVFSMVEDHFVAVFEDITERRRAEDALRVSLTKYQTLFESLPLGITISDDKGKIIESNHTAELLLGLSREQQQKRHIDGHEWTIIQPDGSPMPTEKFASVRALKEHRLVSNVEMGIVKSEGNVTWIDVTAAPIPLEGYGVAITYGDISDRKREERVLLETKNYLENLIGHANAPIITWDPEFRITEFNHAFETLTGMSRQEVMGQTLEILFPEQTRKESMDLIRRTSSGERWEVVEIPIRHVSGKTSTVLWNSANIKNSQGDIVATIAQGQDITERKLAEAALHEREEEFRVIFHNQQTGLLIVDPLTHTIVDANHTALTMIGATRDEVIGRVCHVFVCPAEVGKCPVTDLGKVVDNSERMLITKAGKKIQVLKSVNPVSIKGRNYLIESFIDITDRKRAEKVLLETKDYLENLIGHANAPIITWDPEFRITEFNHAFETLTGMSRQEVMGQTLEILFPEQTKKESMDLIRRTSSGERWEVVEIPIRHVSGNISTVLWNSANIKNSEGIMVATIAQGQDITERKRTENELKLSNILLSTQQEVSIDAILIVDGSGKIISYNTRFIEMWGIPPDVIASRSDERALQSVIEKLVNPQEFLARVRYLYEHKGEKSRDEIALSDGRILDRYSAPMTGSDGINYGRVWFFRDITEVKKAEEAIQQSEERYRTLAEASPDQIFIIGRDDTMKYANTAALKMFHLSYNQVIEKSRKDLFPPDIADAQGILLQKVFETGEHVRKEEIIKFGKHAVWIDTSLVPIKDETGKITAVLGVARDITDRKKAEDLLRRFNEELEQKVKTRTEELDASLQAKILLLREVHHRVKNNLQIIISLVNLQMRQLENPHLKQVMAETRNRVKAMSLVHEKLYQSESLSKIDLADYSRYFVTQLYSFYGTDTKRVKLDIHMGRMMVDINTAIPVGLILNELVSNALKHAFPAGREGTISISGRSDDDTLTLVVKDDGIGMPPVLDWDRPESLGLRLVKNLVDQVDGTIELDQSSGTAVTITIRQKQE